MIPKLSIKILFKIQIYQTQKFVYSLNYLDDLFTIAGKKIKP